MSEEKQPEAVSEESGASELPHEATTGGQKLRSDRLADYLTESLEQPNALVANLGALNSDLMRMQHLLQQLIDSAVGQAGPTLADLEYVMPGIENMLKVTKQIDRFTQLEIKIKAAGDSTKQG